MNPLPLEGKLRISVVVVNWNRRELLRECLDSLSNQTVGAVDICVVDNGSTDGSVELIGESYPQVRLIRNRDNRGFCEANNQGIFTSVGEFVALLNNDARAQPDWLEHLLAAFEQPDVGMAASKILVAERPHLIDKVGHLIWPDGQNRGRGTGETDHGQYSQVEEVAWPDGCAAMYRKSMLDEIGGLDEDLFAYADDAELGLRARIAGWRCLYMPQAVVYHHRGATLGVASGRRLKLIERNRVLLAVKLFPLSLLWLNPFYYGLRVLAGAWAAWRGEGETKHYAGWSGKLTMVRALIEGDLEALAMVPRMWAKRREIERFRKLSPAQIRQLLRQYQIPLRALSNQAN
ncbi:MAG: glycosyltransferase family 2 protein [Acidobacteria bacterium]|nr:glycosyltransferase family 2 protein [Acidobacteriota bacterium]